MKQHEDPKHKKQHFLTFSVYVFVLLFAGNLVTTYIMHYYVMGTTCMTTAQVASDSRCLYIMGNQIYEKATRTSPHQGHPCGSDVTAVVPSSHINNPAAYMLPNYIADVCAAATPTPTPTVTPKPTATATPTLTPTSPPPATATPVPLATPVPTATPRPIATFTPAMMPTATLVPTGTPAPHVTVTATLIPTIKFTLTPTVSISTKQPSATPTVPLQNSPTTMPTTIPSSSATPTLAPMVTSPTPSLTISPTNPALHLSISLVGIDTSAASPLHTEKPITILVYNSTDNPGSATTQPFQTIQGTVTFDAPSASFINPTLTLANVNSGQYQLFVQIPGYIKKQLIADGNPVFSLTAGIATQIPNIKLLSGDIDGNNIVDIADYNELLRCYGLHIANPSPACANPQAADLNDDGIVDSSDYNIFLYSLYAYRQQNNLLPSPTPVATLTATPSSTPTPTVVVSPTSSMQNTPTMTTSIVTATPKALAMNPTSTPKKSSIFTTLVAGVSDKSGILTKILDVIVFLILCGTLALGFIKSSLFSKLMKKQTATAKPPTVTPPIAPPLSGTVDATNLKPKEQVDAGMVK